MAESYTYPSGHKGGMIKWIIIILIILVIVWYANKMGYITLPFAIPGFG